LNCRSLRSCRRAIRLRLATARPLLAPCKKWVQSRDHDRFGHQLALFTRLFRYPILRRLSVKSAFPCGMTTTGRPLAPAGSNLPRSLRWALSWRGIMTARTGTPAQRAHSRAGAPGSVRCIPGFGPTVPAEMILQRRSEHPSIEGSLARPSRLSDVGRDAETFNSRGARSVLAARAI
jgi:hypothetical protein